MRTKRGFELSFGVIFSLIIIAAILATAFYMISNFLSLKNCTEYGLFVRDFQSSIDRAWGAESVKDVFGGRVPGGVDKVCVGNLSIVRAADYPELVRYRDRTANIFFLPPVTSCSTTYGNLNHVRFSGFACADVKSGIARFNLEKDSFDNFVLVQPAK